MFAIWHFASNKKVGGNLYEYGISYSSNEYQLNLKSVGKSALLSIYSVSSVYLLSVIIDSSFHLDFRIWVVALKVMDWHHFVIMLDYLIPFLIYFLVNGPVLHGQFRLPESATVRKTAWKWFGANFTINTLGIIVLILIQYIPLFANGQLFWPDQSLLGIVAFPFVPVNGTVSLISTFFYRKTGKIYEGAFTNALLITWYIVAGQAIQYTGQPASNAGSISTVVAGVVLLVLLLLGKRSRVEILRVYQ